ncbi:cytochrome c oxidase subunit II [Thalassobacillus pellis]|uniref:cytochrome c oxidase subunit II n=1 Tax=Thalassobacillus pellis TaxID=748008 RepID=UPI00195F9A81|nr:cytochrome c oxidase subunit II [Thalassobacillus pellis]MBM7551832.1 cytochrome c oxidase subunit 2 [Thalassobacillus pellis]
MKKLLMLTFLFLLSGCNLRTLDPVSETASDQAFLIKLGFWIMMVVVGVVTILFVAFTLKYRETDKNRYDIPKHEEGNRTLEIIWTVLPIILLVCLAIPTVIITYQASNISANPEETVHVNVTGEQFKWTFEYENGKKTHEKLVLPVNRDVIFHLKSKDVIHSFWVPRLAGKKDVIPGTVNKLEVVPNKTGTYQGKCAEFCGILHADMRFTTEVVSQQDFEEWLSSKKK